MRTSYICVASSFVGATTIDRTCAFLFGSSAFNIRSTKGMRKLNVLPLPVTACPEISKITQDRQLSRKLTSTTKSLFPISRGIAIACTGVVRAKPMLWVKSSIHADNSGVSASKDFGCFFSVVSGAISDPMFWRHGCP
jgi:hypothetical protein